ncbi:hypothetical protein [Lichenifustis flavocetrariae]|uniref:Uncharacterized protein n=1 Tax=Lichenifustis flavocetrariae TaxID=2949735 RepID=A0AA41Z991_9HYPH|nr:hypothetical protein [Lichenifustis flavocetrariae]MCW6512655.1 hypothetical protein [Lichenifustis flavocetrariae]
MPEPRDDLIAWRFDVARNAMGSETLTAYVNCTDREQAWRIVRAKLPRADFLSEVGLSAVQLSWDNQRPFGSSEDLRFA